MNGLSSKEVLESRKLYGSNKLPEPEMKKWYDFAKEALSEKITMILIAIAVLQLFLGFMGVMELSDPIMILVVLAIVTGIAVKTGLGVQKSAAELRAKTAVRYCDVIRDGKVQTIKRLVGRREIYQGNRYTRHIRYKNQEIIERNNYGYISTCEKNEEV